MATVRCEDRPGGVRVLMLDRPPANALDETLLGDLSAALEAARSDDAVRSVILGGTGAFFSAGFDLAAPRRDEAGAPTLPVLYPDTHEKLPGFPQPPVARPPRPPLSGGPVLPPAPDHPP